MLLLVLQVTGTPLYMAPENLRGCHGMEVDVWAAGVMVSRMNISNCCHEQQQQEIIWLLSLSQRVVASTATSAQVPLAEPYAHPGHDLLLSAVVVSSLLIERQEVFNHPALQGTRTCCSKAMVLPIPYDGCCSNSHASQLFDFVCNFLLQLYQLLSDRFPFWDVDLHQIDGLGGAAIREGIMHGPVLFPLQPWCTSVHSSAQDLIVKMLDRNVERRITAAEALQHPWFKEVLGA